MSETNDNPVVDRMSISKKAKKDKFKPTYLYVKTHNVTGLKYFGKTIQNPFLYQGSGKIWRRHIKKHGYDVTTYIVGFFENEVECKIVAMNFSKENNIVESSEWANLMIENGIDGGALVYTEEMRANSRNRMLDMVSNGTHPFLGDFQKSRVNRGEHHLLSGDIQRKYASNNNLKRVSDGTHNFLGSDLNKKRVIDGTHHFVGGDLQRKTAKKRIVEIKELFSSWRDKMFSEGTHPTQIKKLCPYCGKQENLPLFARYHGEKCKMKGLAQNELW